MTPRDDTGRRIAEAQQGSREALGQLLEACRGYLLLIAQREMDSDLRSKGGASDLVQQTFLEAQRDFTGFRGTTEVELLGWLRQILLHNLASFSRKFRETAKRRLAAEVSLEPDRAAADRLRAGTPSPEEQAIAAEEGRRVQEALARQKE